MRLEVTPEPSADELKALRAVLAGDDRPGKGAAAAYDSVWRLAGLLENVDSGLASAAPAGTPGTVSRSNDGASLA